MCKFLIGTITLTEPVVTEIQHECAAWWTKVEVPAGTYPVYGWVSQPAREIDLENRGVNFYQVHVDAQGVVVDEYTGSLYCGVPIPNKPYVKKGIGLPHPAGRMPFNALDRLDPGAKMEKRPYTFTYDGKEHTIECWFPVKQEAAA